MIASILEVGDARQRQAPGFRGGQADIEALGLVVVGNDVLGVGVGLKSGVGQAIQAECLVSAVHVERRTVHREDAVGVGNRSARGYNVTRSGGQEVGGAGHAGKSDVDFVCCQGHDIKIKAERCTKIGHSKTGDSIFGRAVPHLFIYFPEWQSIDCVNFYRLPFFARLRAERY